MYFKKLSIFILSCIILFLTISLPVFNKQNLNHSYSNYDQSYSDFDHSYSSFFSSFNPYSMLINTYYLTEEATYSFNVERPSEFLLNVVSKDIKETNVFYLKNLDTGEVLFELIGKEINALRSIDLVKGEYQLHSDYDYGTIIFKFLIYDK